MAMTGAALDRRLRGAAALVAAGLVVELVSLTWRHPTAFILYVLAGATLVAAGVALFLHAIVSRD